MLFKKWATALAERLSAMADETDSYKIAILRYKLECLFSMGLSILILVVSAALLGILKTAILVSCAGVIIKNFTGGLHLGTPLRCAVFGAVIIIGVSYLAINFPITGFSIYLIVIISLILNIIVWLKAPREAEAKPLTEDQKRFFAVASRILVFVLTVICIIWPQVWGINELFYGLVYQVVSLLDVMKRGMEGLDGILGKIETKPLF